MPAWRCGARTLSGSRSTPRCSPRTSASQPTPSCCTPAIRGLNRLAAKHGVPPRQSYVRIAKRAAMMAGRYAHAKQFNRHRRELRILRTPLGRLIRDISRKIAGQESVEAARALPDPPDRVRPLCGGTTSSSRARTGARLPDPIPAAAPARLEALFIPCARDRMHRQGQPTSKTQSIPRGCRG
jgi:hypothetical protein